MPLRWNHLEQALIFICSALAIVLVNHFDDHAHRLAGNLIGLASQPLWLFSTWRHRQWGMFFDALFYAGIWTAGVFRYW